MINVRFGREIGFGGREIGYGLRNNQLDFGENQNSY